ncbi:hypothetical protein QFC19_000851 [Naganishia cerealis]|uniref:Uncharacterized protein n=1 Tax=Naganishia cerealis TaxID=610337 RepID=A0ACC2WL95_9TREE|nr:hypothetical protein QFC19_000851 [Naganishia cerealis]
MSLRKKPSPKHPHALDECIDEYLNKLPLTSPFREQNPNLHPLDTASMKETENFDNPVNSNFDNSNSANSNSAKSSNSSNSTSSSSLRRSSTFRRLLPKSTSVGNISVKSTSRKRFSLNSSLSKLSLGSPHGSPARYVAANDDDIETTSISSSEKTINNVPYWKYHVLKFGKDLYLTTNPGLKHIYCRNGPSYYVEVVYPNKRQKTAKNGYTLIFKELDGVEKNDAKPPIMMIYKKPEKEGGHYTLSIPQRSRLVQDSIQYSPQPHSLFHGIVIPKGIDSSYIPYDRIANIGRYQELRNYEFKDCNNINWNVGAIPRLRATTLNRLKSKVLQDEDDESLKLFGPRNVYFHQNYIDTRLALRSRANSLGADYLNGTTHDFPPVLAVFRPLETKIRRKLMSKINRMLHSKLTTRGLEQNTATAGLDMNAATAGLDIKSFHSLGDGLYYQTHPVDDEPNENKMGWLTVYEDKQVFAELKYRGMFDIVVGLTLAVGFESQMEKPKSEAEA